jgi:tetratricopeptide (TPR) repeat protein
VRLAAILALLGLIGVGVYITLCWTVWRKDIRFQSIQEAVEQEHLDQAREQVQACLDSWPEDPRFQLLAARIARLSDDFNEAEFRLNECSRLGGKEEAVRLEWALLSAQRGRLAEVETYLRNLVATRPGDPDTPFILEALAEGYQNTFQLTQSQDCLRLWLKHRPNSVRAHLRLAQVFQRLFRVPDALREYDRVLVLDPSRDEARLELAVLLLTEKDTKGARIQFQRLHRHRPDDPQVLLGLAKCWRILGQLDRARPLLRRLVAREPTDAAVFAELGQLALAESHLAEAERWLRRSLQGNPNDYPTNYALFRCLQRQGKTEEAAKYQARSNQIARDFDRCQDILLQHLSKKPHDASLRSEMGVILIRRGQERAGVGWLQSALLEDPGHKPSHQALADYYQRQGQVDLAQKHRWLAAKGVPQRRKE